MEKSTKEDFLVETNGEQFEKKLTKKQAKKLAKDNRKSQTDSINDENEHLTKKIAGITLQSSPGEFHFEEKDDKLVDMNRIKTPNASIYRRHMSESQADLGTVSNGEFKLKVT